MVRITATHNKGDILLYLAFIQNYLCYASIIYNNRLKFFQFGFCTQLFPAHGRKFPGGVELPNNMLNRF
jgi:hypothetical protein